MSLFVHLFFAHENASLPRNHAQNDAFGHPNHAVLVSNDMRNGFTTNAARVSVAAAARLARLVVDYLLASEALPPTLEEARTKALTPFISSSHMCVFSPSRRYRERYSATTNQAGGKQLKQQSTCERYQTMRSPSSL